MDNRDEYKTTILDRIGQATMYITLLGFTLIGIAAVTALVQHAVCHN
jgi:hypothetical protein